jgi:hypothetical protein
VSLERTENRLRVEVSDDGDGHPIVRPADPTAVSGRGLQAVELLSDSWGIETRPGAPGKTVWFTISACAVAKEA